VKVVSDASPLIALARVDCLDLLRKLYGNILIPTAVYEETVVAGVQESLARLKLPPL
jgi:predicted nucleic acid-binding protein